MTTFRTSTEWHAHDRRLESQVSADVCNDAGDCTFCSSTPSKNSGGRRRRSRHATSPSASASTRCGRPVLQVQQAAHWLSSSGLGTMGFGLPAAMGVQAAHPDTLVIDIDGDGSFLMNIQELATLHCEKLPVKILLLNNQHLGMVVQWEDRSIPAAEPTLTWARSDHPEALGEGDGINADGDLSRISCRSPKATASRPTGPQQGRIPSGARGNDRPRRPIPAGRDLPVPGTRAAHDPEREDRAGHHCRVGVGFFSRFKSNKPGRAVLDQKAIVFLRHWTGSVAVVRCR